MLRIVAATWVEAAYLARTPAHDFDGVYTSTVAYDAAVTYRAAHVVDAAASAYGIHANTPQSLQEDVSAFDAFISAADAAIDSSVIWATISTDTRALDAGVTAAALASRKLWPGRRPDWVTANWKRLKKALLDAEEDWSVWTDWYDARLKGGAANEALEIARALIAAEIWESGPKVVNAEIRRLIRSSALAKNSQEQVGNRWKVEKDRYRVDSAGSESDAVAAGEPTVVQLHEGVRRKAKSLSELGRGLNDQLGWTGFEESIQRFAISVDVETSEIALRIGTVYDVTLELASFLQFDNDLREHPKGNVGRLPPDVRRSFTDLVRTAAPWVRSFPTGQRLDNEAGALLARPDLYEPSKLILQSAHSIDLISEQDRASILALLSAIERAGFPADKAGVRGVQSTKNLVLAALAFVAGFYINATSSDYATKSPLVIRTGTFLAEREKEITKFLSDAPDDIRIAVSETINLIKKGGATRDAPTDSTYRSIPRAITRREDE